MPAPIDPQTDISATISNIESKMLSLNNESIFPITGSKEIVLSENIRVTGIPDFGGVKNGDTFPAGVSLTRILKKILMTALPVQVRQPSVSFSIKSDSLSTGQFFTSRDVEVGRALNDLQIRYTFNPGLYTIDPNSTPPTTQPTNVSCESGYASLTLNGTTVNVQLDATGLSSGSRDYTVDLDSDEVSSIVNDEDDIIIGDGTSFTVTGSIVHSAGDKVNNNLGEEIVSAQIQAGTIHPNAVSITGKRKLFYGYDNGVSAIDSNRIRGLESTGGGSILGPSRTSNFQIKLLAGNSCKRFIIAFAQELNAELASVLYVEDGNSNYTALFNKSNDAIDVSGLNGYSAKPYDVYTMGTADDAYWNGPVTFNVTLKAK